MPLRHAVSTLALTAMSDAAPTAQLEDVDVILGGNHILHRVRLTLPAGCVTAVIGASGSGKSTLLRLLNGLVTPQAGTVYRHGQSLTPERLRDVRRDTGYAMQQIGLLPHLSIADNIALPLRLAGRDADAIADRLTSLLDAMQLSPELAARYPAAASGGQQQRAGLARALALEPELLLLDEAFSGLDAITRLATHQQFLALRGTEIKSALLVTHDLDEAARLADRLVILNAGRIVREGPRDDVLADPRDPYAIELVEAFQCAG
ncbi:MAG: ATP-binding cassette domain-containing protein [Pseudomonadota bacterium]